MTNSAISTEAAPRGRTKKPAAPPPAPDPSPSSASAFLPWHFFVLAILASATAAVLVLRGAKLSALVMLILIIVTAGLAGLAVFRTLLPLVRADAGDRTEMVGRRTRTSLDRQKTIVLRAIKEFEFDRAMGKVSDSDFEEMTGRLRARAAGLIKQLEAGDGYRALIERELATRLKDRGEIDVAQAAAAEVEAEADEARAADSPGGAGVLHRLRLAQRGRRPLLQVLRPQADGVTVVMTMTDSRAMETPEVAGAGAWRARLRAAGRCAAQAAVLLAGLMAALVVLAPPVHAQMQMPDPRQMSGIPRPDSHTPDGTVVVRVIRGSFDYNAVGQLVRLVADDGTSKSVKTDEEGHATFTGFAPGVSVTASTDLDGEHLVSDKFPFPQKGGVILMLVGKLPKGTLPATTPEAKAIPGTVVLGPQSRIIMDPGDEKVELYYLLSIVNNARAPVMPPSTLIVDMPSEGQGTALLEGSDPQATVKDNRVTIPGPFKPGQTIVQVGTVLPVTSGDLNVKVKLPVSLESLAVIVRKLGESDIKFTSPQAAAQQDLNNNGQQYIAATGPAVPAGQTITLSLSGLPHHSEVPVTIALVLAIAIGLIGVWAVAGARTTGRDEARRRKLEAQRDRLFGELVQLEEQHAAGRLGHDKYTARRSEIVARLERIYGQLEDEGVAAGGDQGLAA